MKGKTQLTLAAGVLLLAAGGIATLNDTEEQEYAVHHMAGWGPTSIKASTIQWGTKGNVQNVNAAETPFDRKGSGKRGQVAFTFVMLPAGDQHSPNHFWCSVTVHGKTKTAEGGERECYVAVGI